MKVTALAARIEQPELEPKIDHVSDTALIVARIRGRESLRPDRLFEDRFAFKLAGRRGEELGVASERKWFTRFLSKGIHSAIVLRTATLDRIIERAVREDGIDCVVNLGAGLDTRPYRLNLPPSLKWIEVDFPPVIAEKQRLMEREIARCNVEYLPLDLREERDRAQLFGNLKSQGKSVLVLTEGLLLYLTESEVIKLAKNIRGAGVKRWVLDLNSPRASTAMARVWSVQLGQSIQFQFGHDAGTRFFACHKWKTAQELPVFEQRKRFNRDTTVSKIFDVLCKLLGKDFTNKIRRSSVVFDLTPIEFSK